MILLQRTLNRQRTWDMMGINEDGIALKTLARAMSCRGCNLGSYLPSKVHSYRVEWQNQKKWSSIAENGGHSGSAILQKQLML